MSSTRSPSPKAPATDRNAIIVSHGQPSEPAAAEAELARFAADVARHLPGWRITGATLAAEQALEAALAGAGSRPLIYPLFMTGGWFASEALRARLEGSQAQILPPFGIEPELPALAAGAVCAVMQARGWQAPDTRLLLAAHGSGRSENSARDTRRFADALRALVPFGELRIGFIEEPPYLADMAFDLGAQSICLPFFAARRGHVLDDLPEALEPAQFAGVELAPIGLAPGVHALVARVLRQALAAV